MSRALRPLPADPWSLSVPPGGAHPGAVTLTRLRSDELIYTWLDQPGTPMQIGLLGAFEAAPFLDHDGVVDVARIREELAARASRVEPLRRRIAWTRPGEGRPVWAADPSFDARDRIATATVPADADPYTWAADQAARPLDRERPLWRAVVADGLPGPRFAVLIIVSHVLADGLAGVALAGSLFDPDPERVVARPPLAAAPPLPSHRELLLDRLRALRRSAFPRGHRSVRRPGLRQLRRATAGFAGPEPATSLPRHVGPHRRLAVTTRPLEEVRRTGHALGVTVNDLLLAAVTDGLRRLVTSRGEPLPGELRCTVPTATGGAGRQVTGMLLVRLPVGDPDRLRRLARIHRATVEGKAQLRAGAEMTDLRLPAFAAKEVVRWTRRLGSRRMTLSISDVPGPASPLWLAGARLLSAVPIAPMAPLVPLSVAALSYAGALTISVNSDAAVPDLDQLTDGVAASLAEYAELARAVGRPTSGAGPSGRDERPSAVSGR